MTQLGNLDRAELAGWLTRTTQAIDRSLRDAARGDATAALGRGLEGTRVGLPILAQLALLDDCLRVAHLAIEADGVIEEEELARIGDLVRVAAPKYFAVLPRYETFADGTSTDDDVARFVRAHRGDPGPFGFGCDEPWRGLALARSVEQHTRNASPLRDHERMLARVMETVFDGRSTDVERAARRRLRELFEPVPTSVVDPRAVAFCRADGPEIFASVAHGSQIHARDPYDVEAIHGEAREALYRMVERATTPASQERSFGRTLLVLGGAGAGKTHLLRALRTQVCSQRMGYVGYLQMTLETGDYTRYVLRSLIDSLEAPYDAPGLAESGLMYLSDGIADGRAQIPAGDLEQLRSAELSGPQLESLLGRCVDRILRTEGLGELDGELLQALLLLQRRDPAIQRRVVRYLRCDALNHYDREVLGGLAPRDRAEHPASTLKALARIMYELHYAALVLLVDQIEDALPDLQTVSRLQNALNSLRGIADTIPSAVVVVSCLDDVYSAIRGKLSQPLVDRLENDPPLVRLRSERDIAEIEQMLICRLESLYSAFDVSWQEDDPLYPFQPAQLEAVRNYRAREVLKHFREYRESCVVAGTIVAPPEASGTRPTSRAPGMTGSAVGASPPPGGSAPAAGASAPPGGAATAPGTDARPRAGSTTSPPVDQVVADPTIDRAHKEILAGDPAVPDDDSEVITLVEDAVRTAAAELGLAIATRREAGGLVIESDGMRRRTAAACNGRGQGGHLGRQLEALQKAAGETAIAVALRGADWQGFGPKTTTGQKIAAFKQAGGRTIQLQEHEQRAVVVARMLAKLALPGFDVWQRARKHVSQLAFVRELLDLDRIREAAPPPPKPPTPPTTKAAPQPKPADPPQNPRLSGPIPVFDPTQVRLGVLTTIRAEPVMLPLEQVKKHAAFLGTPGSGKTTVALSITEQLLERGISVMLVDRKGDLARYASDAWWSDASSGDLARKAHLREKVTVSLFTPGNPHGRPLRLPLVPSLRDAGAHDREQLAKYAASGLTAMLGLPRGVATTHKESVLKCAIEVLADEPEITLDLLHQTISRPDPNLLVAVDTLQKHFASLGECLQALRIQRGTLLSGEGEPLDVAALLPPPCDRPRLTIINTSALAEVSVLQFWVSRLLVEIARVARTRPSPTLQAAVFFDEADAYIPATSEPATKAPMFDLLRRARATGFGIMLATQNPGDIDYKGRDNIATWLVGKVASARAIEKMRNLLASYPNVGPRLASQAPGAFFVLAEGEPPKEIRADRALMSTEQLSEHEVIALAKATSGRS